MEVLTKVGPIMLGVMCLGFYLFLLGCNAKLPPKIFQGKVSILILSLLILLWTGSNAVMRITAPPIGELVLADILKQVHPPVQLNTVTSIDSIVLEGETIVYNMSLNASPDEARTQSDAMKNEFSKTACDEPGISGALKLGLSVQLRFKDATGASLEPHTIRPADCKFPTK